MSDQTERQPRRPRRRILADEEDDDDEVEQLHKQNHDYQQTTSRYETNDATPNDNNSRDQKDPRKVAFVALWMLQMVISFIRAYQDEQ